MFRARQERPGDSGGREEDWGFPQVTGPALVQYAQCMCADIYGTKRSNVFVPRAATLDSVPGEIIAKLGNPAFLNTPESSDPLLRSDTPPTRPDRGFQFEGLNAKAGVAAAFSCLLWSFRSGRRPLQITHESCPAERFSGPRKPASIRFAQYLQPH